MVDKPESDYHRNAARADGLLAYCKPCWAAIGREHRYGITQEEFDQLMVEQDGACAICVNPFILAPHVDHCHATGSVRGLLCTNCNTGLGKFRDSVENLQRAIAYLS
jgi:hypothetical protein